MPSDTAQTGTATLTETVALDIRQLSYGYPHFRLDALNFTVRRGELFAILGPNAAGKSTLLKLLGGLLDPEAGAVLLDGDPVHKLDQRERARRVAMVQQESPVLFPLDGLSFVLQGRHAYRPRFGFETGEDLEVAEEALRLTRTTHLRDRLVQELSGGEKQRVVLARALAQQPELLLLDEPTLHLDIGFQVELLRLVRQLAKEKNYAVVLVSHELNLAAEFADTVLLLHQGKALALGPPRAVFEQHRLEQIFQTGLTVSFDPESGRPRVHVRAARDSEESSEKEPPSGNDN